MITGSSQSVIFWSTRLQYMVFNFRPYLNLLANNWLFLDSLWGFIKIQLKCIITLIIYKINSIWQTLAQNADLTKKCQAAENIRFIYIKLKTSMKLSVHYRFYSFPLTATDPFNAVRNCCAERNIELRRQMGNAN